MTTHRRPKGKIPVRPRPVRPPAAAERRQPTFIERYRGPLLGGIAIVIVAALAIIFVLKFGPTQEGKEAASGAQPVAPAVLTAVTQIPQTVYDGVGAGSATNPPKAISGAPALTQDGKPQVFYLGGEFCPYCAAERWSMVAALSRFGSFSNLQAIRSSTSDVFPGTPTFTFYGSTYTSQYIAFTPVEQYTNQPSGNGYTTLQDLTPDQQTLVNTYNRTPYTASGIPFVDFGNKYAFSGATYSPGVLANMDWQQIADALAKPASPQAQGIVGSANLISATICQLTAQQPANVCNSTGVQKASTLLGKS